MRRVFADAYYLVALLNDRDQGHVAARAIGEALRGATLVTTEEVLAEVLGFFAGRGRHLRHAASALVEGILGDPAIVVRPQSHAGFLRGLALYGARPDKGYSLTAGVSMPAMRQEGLTGVLTRDRDFAQGGSQPCRDGPVLGRPPCPSGEVWTSTFSKRRRQSPGPADRRDDPACHGPMAYAYNPVPSFPSGRCCVACGHAQVKSGRRSSPLRPAPPRYHDRPPGAPRYLRTWRTLNHVI